MFDENTQNEEWEQYQSDLLMTVRVANDFKTETQVAYENLVIDNKTQRDKIRALEQEIVKLNKGKLQRQNRYPYEPATTCSYRQYAHYETNTHMTT